MFISDRSLIPFAEDTAPFTRFPLCKFPMTGPSDQPMSYRYITGSGYIDT